MKKSINFKKILATVGLASIFIPTSLNVIACEAKETENYTDSVIAAINSIKDLKINISENETTETIFNILNNSEKGLATAIAKHDIYNYDKKLFKLDTENVYTDTERNNKVTEDQKIKVTSSYYFAFTYANKANNTVIPVTITNREKEVRDAIKNTNYDIGVVVGTKVATLQELINFNFIKSFLDPNIQNIFDDSLFHLNQIMINEEEITDDNLFDFGLITTIINFDYGTIKNQTTILKINKKWPEVTKEEFVKLAEERSNHDPMIFTIKVKQAGTYDYLPSVLQQMRVKIYTEFLNTYHLTVDISKLKMEDIHSDEMKPVRFSNSWFETIKQFNAIGSTKYDNLSTGPINIKFNIVSR